MTIRLNEAKWGKFLVALIKSKGLTAQVTELVFEKINSTALQNSGLEEEVPIYFSNASKYIHDFLDVLNKSSERFHMKGVTIKGTENLQGCGGIDDESFEYIITKLMKPKLQTLYLWDIDLTQGNKATTLSTSISKKGLQKPKGCQPLGLKLIGCKIDESFKFINDIEKNKLDSLALRECNLKDGNIPNLLKYIKGMKNLKSLDFSCNQLSYATVEELKKLDGQIGKCS